MLRRTALLLICGTLCWFGESSFGAAAARPGPVGSRNPGDFLSNPCKIVGRVIDKATGEIVPARLYVRGSDNELYVDSSGVVYLHRSRRENQSLIDGEFSVEVPPGATTITAHRGPEYLPAEITVEATPDKTVEVELTIERWSHMAEEGWYSGEFHLHLNLERVPAAMLAEDLNVAPVITRHIPRNKPPRGYWQDKELPADHRVIVDDTHVYSVYDVEIERLRKAGRYGAYVFCDLKKPFEMETSTYWPTDGAVIDEIKSRGGHVNGEKPFWKTVVIHAALGDLDSMGIACNHIHPNSTMLPLAELYALERPDEYDKESDRDFALWVMELYYRYLNCGFRIPAVSGTAYGLMATYAGFNRAYAKVEGEFSYDNWFDAVEAGRTFATNGPMMRFTVDGKDPGAEIAFGKGEAATVTVNVEATTMNSLEKLEIIQDGEIVATIEGGKDIKRLVLEKQLTFKQSGWIAARSFEIHNPGQRFAQTSPVYVTVEGTSSGRPKAAKYFLGVVEHMIEETENASYLKDEDQRQGILSYQKRARDVYAGIVNNNR